MGYSPQGCKELDRTERLHFHFDPVITGPFFQAGSFAQSCPTRCDPVTCSSLGFPVHHQLPELTQTHVKWVDRAESSKEPEPVPSVSSVSDIAACPPLFADDPSALPSPTLSLLQSVTLLACPLDASPSVPGAARCCTVLLYFLRYCTVRLKCFIFVFVFYVLFV